MTCRMKYLQFCSVSAFTNYKLIIQINVLWFRLPSKPTPAIPLVRITIFFAKLSTGHLDPSSNHCLPRKILYNEARVLSGCARLIPPILTYLFSVPILKTELSILSSISELLTKTSLYSINSTNITMFRHRKSSFSRTMFLSLVSTLDPRSLTECHAEGTDGSNY